MPNVYIDLETLGTDDPTVIAEIAATINAPGQYKKPESIANWEATEKPRVVEEAVNRTSFDACYGRVICAGIAVEKGYIFTFYEGDERQIISDLFTSIDSGFDLRGDATFVGHNVTFDLRFLFQRACVLNLKPPPVLLKAMHAKPWELADTMLIWSGTDRDKRISLDKLCKVLGIDSPKGEVNGSMVAQLYRDGEIEKIAEYCKRDVEAVRACYRRLSFQEVA